MNNNELWNPMKSIIFSAWLKRESHSSGASVHTSQIRPQRGNVPRLTPGGWGARSNHSLAPEAVRRPPLLSCLHFYFMPLLRVQSQLPHTGIGEWDGISNCRS